MIITIFAAATLNDPYILVISAVLHSFLVTCGQFVFCKIIFFTKKILSGRPIPQRMCFVGPGQILIGTGLGGF